MASLKMSFIDALRVAARTKDAPKDWVQTEQANAPSWPATLSELVRNPQQSKKRFWGEEGPSGARTPGTPELPCHPGLTPFSSPSLHSLPPSPGLGLSYSAVPCHRSSSLPKPAKESSLATPQKEGSFEPLHRVHSSSAAPSLGGTVSPALPPNPGSAPPGAKRRKPFDMGWINAVASSIRGPWAGERSAAEDEVASQLLSRTPSVTGFANAEDGSGENFRDSAPTGAIRTKLKEGVLQRVFEERQMLQKSFSSLPDIMQLGEHIFCESQQEQQQQQQHSISPEGSETAPPLQRSTRDPRRLLSPADSDSSGSGCKQGAAASGLGSSLVSASAIQKCLVAAPPRRPPAPSASISSTLVASAGSSRRLPVPQRTNAVAASAQHAAEGLLSSSVLAKCLAATPPRRQMQKKPLADSSSSQSRDGSVSAKKQPVWFSAESLQQNVNAPLKARPCPNPSADTGHVSAQVTEAAWSTFPGKMRIAGKETWTKVEVKAARSLDEGDRAAWCPSDAPGQNVVACEDVDILIDEFLLDPAADTKVSPQEGNQPPAVECVEALAAACMDTLTNLISGGSNALLPGNSAVGQAVPSGGVSEPANRPAPLLVDAEVLASVCPDVVAELYGGSGKGGEVTEFEWDGDLPTPNMEGGSDADLWAEALKAELPSPTPCNGSGRLW